jgi:hypothetical protein
MSITVNPWNQLHRRQFLRQGSAGIGGLALASLLAPETSAASSERPASPHFAPKAKNIIFLFMAGAPSQLDLFDDKPELRRRHGEVATKELLGSIRFPFVKEDPELLGSPYKFRRHGQSGAIVSELMPHLAGVADDLAFIKSMHTSNTAINHQDGQLFFTTGALREGRPSLGAWLSYGLGSENEDLPRFVVLLSNKVPRGGASIFGHGFLPATHQGVPFRTEGEPVLFMENPAGVTADARHRSVDTINDLNRLRLDAVGDPEIAARIASFEMAYRMQTSVPELMNIDREPEWVHRMYGAEPGVQSFANNCLLARRLVERGVRMVQLVDLDWDHHGDRKERDIIHALPAQCRSVDQAVAALIQDLKRRGLLEETLVVWGAEFGRTPMNEERGGSKFLGRDHQTAAFTIWMAGGGVRPGFTLGATDPLGLTITEHPVHTHDLHATILHLMGIDHERLTYRFQGRPFRLTDVHGDVVHEVLA